MSLTTAPHTQDRRPAPVGQAPPVPPAEHHAPTHRTWLPWSDVGPVATAAFEKNFVAELQWLANGTVEAHERHDVTAVLNALRAGLTPEELLERAPGLRAPRLLGGYAELERQRRHAERAWLAIVELPTVHVLARQQEDAARLVPVLVDRLVDATLIDPGILPRAAAHMAAAVTEAGRHVHRVETELDLCTDPDRRMSISQMLYDPHEDCLFGRAEHLPTRVGALVPTRVAALLGERETFREVPTD